MYDLEQLIWKAHLTMFFIYFLSSVCSLSYLLYSKRLKDTVLSRPQILSEVVLWGFAIPMVIVLGFGFVRFGTIGVMWLYQNQCVVS